MKRVIVECPGCKLLFGVKTDLPYYKPEQAGSTKVFEERFCPGCGKSYVKPHQVTARGPLWGAPYSITSRWVA